MLKREEMKELLDKEEEIRSNRIIAEKDGNLFVTFEDAAVLNSVNAYDPKGTGAKVLNPDGTLASTGKRVHALNPDFFFANRYRVKGSGSNKKMHIVSGHSVEGFRCIKEQKSGHIFVKTVPCYVIARNEKGELALEKVITVSDSEFISEFTNTLNKQSMAEILPLIVDHGVEITADAMPI